jgi:hypothetical protein
VTETDDIMAETTQSAQTPDESVEPEQAKSQSEKPTTAFPIVGIGASAGGVAAFEASSPYARRPAFSSFSGPPLSVSALPCTSG